ncbi:MAG: precorrin-4 C(11)-methyltransferase [Cyanobacteria bacterium J06621_3]
MVVSMNLQKLTNEILPAVYIVGAGPGDPDLLTVKAQKLIEQADVLIYANSLVPTQILSAIRPSAEQIATANMTLEDIVPLMIERVREGKSVVRLHSGDPSLYSAIHEQMLRLSEADVPFEVIPGISAFQAAAAKLQVELTIPAQVQSIILTRISGRTQVPETEELAGLAAHKTSLCLYLSARHVSDAQAQLMAHYPADTPVAICFRVGWPDEKIWVVPLSQMAAVSEAENLVRTTLYIISPALANRAGMSSAGEDKEVRSRLYNPTHTHLFRPPDPKPPDPKPPDPKLQKPRPQDRSTDLEKEQECAKR